MAPTASRKPRRVLVLDVGGSHVQGAFSDRSRSIRILSGPKMTPSQMVRRLEIPLKGQPFDAVAIGYPGVVRAGAIVREPFNLGGGWVRFDFEKAFGRPVRILNDAAM